MLMGMSRRPRDNGLTVLERRILTALGDDEMYGRQLGELLGMPRDQRYGPVYIALRRLAGPPFNLLRSRLEPARIATRERRPRRRLYRRREETHEQAL
jgi:hypothetical protein